MYYHLRENIAVFWKYIATQTGLHMLNTATNDSDLILIFILKIIYGSNL